MNFKIEMNKVPFGVQDYLCDECELRQEVLDKIMGVFKKWGFKQIDTPSIEYYDTFSLSNVDINQKRMFKMTDVDGSLLVLRPDITLPISRIVATKMGNSEINKLCYAGNIFKTGSTKNENLLREQFQAGVEFIGRGGTDIDADMIALAIESLKKVGIKNCIVEIGHVDFFNGLMKEHGINDVLAEEIRKLVEKKNMLEVEMLLYKNNVAESAKKCLTDIATLFGGREVINKARKMCCNETSLNALSNIEKIFDVLVNYGYEENITIDFSLVQDIGYYTGMVFKCMTSGIGVPILSGGRYDKLLSNFGKNLPATGFAIDIKRVLIALEKQGNLKVKSKKIVSVLDLDCNKISFDKINELRKVNVVERVYGISEQEFVKKYDNCDTALIIKNGQVKEL